MQFAGVTGVDSTAHLGDFLKAAGALLLLFFFMVAAVRLSPVERAPEDTDVPPVPVAGKPMSVSSRRRRFSTGLSSLGWVVLVAGGVLYVVWALKTAASIVIVVGLVLHASGRLLKPFSVRRKTTEAASSGALILMWILPTAATVPLLGAAAVLYFISTRPSSGVADDVVGDRSEPSGIDANGPREV